MRQELNHYEIWFFKFFCIKLKSTIQQEEKEKLGALEMWSCCGYHGQQNERINQFYLDSRFKHKSFHIVSIIFSIIQIILQLMNIFNTEYLIYLLFFPPSTYTYVSIIAYLPKQ